VCFSPGILPSQGCTEQDFRIGQALTIKARCCQAAAGVDAVLVSSAFAGGGLISRNDYEIFVLPYEKKLIDEIHAEYPNVKIYTHTCGAIGDRLDLMLRTGSEGIDTLDPLPLGAVELEEAIPTLQGKAFIKCLKHEMGKRPPHRGGKSSMIGPGPVVNRR